MLLVHQSGSVKVGELIRYTLTYEPSADRILPSPQNLFVRIKNTSAIPLRAAYLHGPYAIHVAVYPHNFDPNSKVKEHRKYGIPQFEPNLKAGGSFSAKIPVPEEVRVSGTATDTASGMSHHGNAPKSVSWVIEITSQILFSSSASVNFEVLVSRDERSLDYSFATLAKQGHGPNDSGRIEDHQHGSAKHGGRRSVHTKGVYSKAVRLVINNTESLWNTPPLPRWDSDKDKEKSRRSMDSSRRKGVDGDAEHRGKKKRVHLVVLTHGLHSNLSADMLYLKESIDATAKEARESRRRRKQIAVGEKPTATTTDENVTDRPLLGNKSEVEAEDRDEDEDEEEIVVRGFTGNVVKTENGIQYLGKRMAKWLLDLTYPDQPYRTIKRSMSQKLAGAVGSKKAASSDAAEQATHNKSTIRRDPISNAHLPYTFSSISFIGHSLGGLTQLYAIGYIQKHAPHFFDHIKPVNFVCMATPLLGLSNENPMYVKFALDFGLVGRTGQDLGLTWRPPTLAKNGWSAMGFGTGKEDPDHPDPGAKPLLRILPTGPAHHVLRQFRNRTVYANVVNDGVVPLRTSCLLFLDWRGLNRVQKARRENGILGTVANWGWSELTGASSSSHLSNTDVSVNGQDGSDDEAKLGNFENTVPQPELDETNQDYQEQRANGAAEHHLVHESRRSQESDPRRSVSPPNASALDGLRNFLGLTSKTTKKDLRMLKRSQTLQFDGAEDDVPGSSSTEEQGRVGATRGDSMEGDPNSNAPPKTSIFESAGDILNPPIPPTSWIIDPAMRQRTIFHDRVYHPEDIPKPTLKRTKTSERTIPTDGSTTASSAVGTAEVSTSDSNGTMKVEEKIARAYHKDLSWRKVLVRLEPDAHNNMIVRRMFANAYGWPVVKHLCNTHFADTYSARTRDEKEPAIDRAKGTDKPVSEEGEHVKWQKELKPPGKAVIEMRESADELMPLRDNKSDVSPRAASFVTSITRGSSYDSFDSRYYDDSEGEEELRGGLMNRFWSPLPKNDERSKEPSQASERDDSSRDQLGTPQAEIAEFLTTEPAKLMESQQGLQPTPRNPTKVASPRDPADAEQRTSVKNTARDGEDAGSIGAAVAQGSGKGQNSGPSEQ